MNTQADVFATPGTAESMKPHARRGIVKLNFRFRLDVGHFILRRRSTGQKLPILHFLRRIFADPAEYLGYVWHDFNPIGESECRMQMRWTSLITFETIVF